MNALICTNLDAHTPQSQAAIPPPRMSSRAPGQPVRILFINGNELGFGTTARGLQHATSLRDDIHAVHFSVVMPKWLRIVCAQSPVKWVHKSGLDLGGSRMILAWDRVVWGFLRGALHAERFDVVHIMTQQRGLCTGRLKRVAGVKVVINSDATTLSFDKAFGYHPIMPRIHSMMERRIFHAADAVACASNWVADSVVDDYGTLRERTFLHMPCARRLPGALPRRPDAHIGRAGLLRMAFVGNDWERKGGPRLLQWHQMRWADRAELHVCSGKAPKNTLARNVVWHGSVPHEKLMRELLPSMDMFVMPTFEDTFLIAAQEAQALGLPVVSSRLAGIPEVVLDGQTGLLRDRRDDAGFIEAVESLLSDPALLTRFSAAAVIHADRHLDSDTWHNHLLDQLIRLADGHSVIRAPARS